MDVSILKQFLDDKEVSRFDMLQADLDRMPYVNTETYKTYRRRINHFFTVIWYVAIEQVFLHHGRFLQFDEAFRSDLLMMRPPSLPGFEKFRERVAAMDTDHPIKARMIEILGFMTPLLRMADRLDEIKNTAMVGVELREQSDHEFERTGTGST
jgi:hypothetical protein